MIIILCGPPGAGKSTMARRLVKELDDAYLLSSDWFKRKVYARIFREVEGRLGKQKYLILDGTFYRKKYRDKIEEIASGKEKVMTVYVDCPLEVCLERNRGRERPIPEAAVYMIWNEFERPEDPDIHIDIERVSSEQAVELILDKLKTMA